MPKINNVLSSDELFFTIDIDDDKTIKGSCIDDHSSLDEQYLQKLKKIRSKNKKHIDQANAGIALTAHYDDPLVSSELKAATLAIEEPSVKTKRTNIDLMCSLDRNQESNITDAAKRVLVMKKDSNKASTTTSPDLIKNNASDKRKKVDGAVKQIPLTEKSLNKSIEVTPRRVSHKMLNRRDGAKENILDELRVVENKKLPAGRINQQQINLTATHDAKGLPQASYDNRITSRIASEINHDLTLNISKKQFESLSREKLGDVKGLTYDGSVSKLKNNKKADKNNLVAAMGSKVNVEGQYENNAVMQTRLDRGTIGSAIKHMIEYVEKELSAPTISQTSQEENVIVYHFNQWQGNNSVTFHFDKDKSELLYMEPSNTFVEKQLGANLDSFPAKYRAYIRDGEGQENRKNQHQKEENDEKDNK